jgi:hypothetical protein
MVVNKLKYRLARIRDYLRPKFGRINLGMIFGAILYVLLITVLAVNAYTAYNRGIDNLKTFGEEEAATSVLIKQNQDLQTLYRYYSSIDYKLIYARDNLNLAQKGETLYLIEKNQPLDVETIQSPVTPVVQNNLLLWSKLLFGG